MINRLAFKLTCYIENNSKFNKIEELEQIQYALHTILNEVFKIIILIILFSVIGNLNYLLFSMIILLSIRLFSGGIHAKTLLGCLMWTTLFFTLTSIIAPLLPKLNSYVYYILSLLTLAVIIVQTPYPNPKRPIKKKKRKQYLKILAVSFSIFWTYVLLFKIYNSAYLNCGIATILLQSSQLIYIKKEMRI
jgi:accessory gene regulator B